MKMVSVLLCQSCFKVYVNFLYIIGVVIGFVETLYIVLEDDGQQQVCAELRMGTLRTNVEVQFTTANGDAMGISAHVS